MLCTMVQKDWFWKTLEVPAKKKKKVIVKAGVHLVKDIKPTNVLLEQANSICSVHQEYPP